MSIAITIPKELVPDHKEVIITGEPCTIEIYSGTKPKNQYSTNGTILAVVPIVMVPGTNIREVARLKESASCMVENTGVAGWFRFIAKNGRFYNGTIGVSGCGLNMLSIHLTAGSIISIDSMGFNA